MIRRHFGALLGAMAAQLGVEKAEHGQEVPHPLKPEAWQEPDQKKDRSGGHSVSPTARAKRKKRRQMARESRRRNRS